MNRILFSWLFKSVRTFFIIRIIQPIRFYTKSRNTYNFFLKSILAVTLFIFQLHAFSQNTYYSRNDNGVLNVKMRFETLSNWNTQADGFGQKPSQDEMDGKTRAHFIVQPHIFNTTYIDISISQNQIMASLTIQPWCKVRVTNNCTVDISEYLKMQSNAILIYEYKGCTITVGGDLQADANATIAHHAAGTNTLILKGKSNTLGIFDLVGLQGTSIVSYIGNEDQTLFGGKYQNLVLGGSGIKTLTSPPNQTVTEVTDRLSITDCILQLNDLDLAYAGTEANLKTNKGWVHTNKTGSFRNTNKSGNEKTKTFPVGSATAMQKITLLSTASGDISKIDIGMRFDPTKINAGALPANGLGAWEINIPSLASQSSGINITDTIYPQAGNPQIISPSSKIASIEGATAPSWKVMETTFSTNNLLNNYTSTLNINNVNTWLMLYNCPVYNITPTSIPFSYVGDTFNDIQFAVNSNNSSVTDITNLVIYPPLKDFRFNSGVLNCSSPAQKPPFQNPTRFSLTYTDPANCIVQQPYLIKVFERPSPNLSILPIGDKTFSTDSFRVRTYSRSTGKITYSISGGCATINDSTGFVKFICAGPSPNNLITVTASQVPTLNYKAESVSKSFVISPAPGRVYVKNFAFVTNTLSAPIKMATRPTPAIVRFDQLSGLSVASVDDNGMVQTYQNTGKFTVQISLAATVNYTAFDSVYTFNVYTLNKPPIAVGDTIILEMGTDSTFNILLNDRGQTSEIIPDKTDIDIDNRGQQIKYYATELGNFTIDTIGNLTILPFYGFIGSGRLGYTVTDINGLNSEVAYVEITIKPPFVIPELKANDIMTPNNDNLNDALVISNTDLNKENSLMIMDELGNAVYEQTNYQNNWEGTNAKNNKLEPGVYFYVFKEKNTGRELKKYIQIL